MEISIKTTARIGGILYLINIILGVFAIGYVASVIVAANDAAATAKNILTHELFYRAGLAAHVIILLTNVPLAVIFYRLFKIVSKKVSMLVIFFTLIGTAIECVSLISQFAPLIFFKNENLFKAFNIEQLQSLSYAFLKFETIGLNLALIFFGCYCMLMGYLIFKSTFLPKLIGVFMAFGGVCYLFNGFANIVNPQFAAILSPYIQLPSGLGEISLCLWFLVAGVNINKWKEKARLRNSNLKVLCDAL